MMIFGAFYDPLNYVIEIILVYCFKIIRMISKRLYDHIRLRLCYILGDIVRIKFIITQFI